MVKKGLMLFTLVFLLSACNDDEATSSDAEELREDLIRIHQLEPVGELDKTMIDDGISDAEELNLQGEDRDWFMFYHLIYATTGQEADREQVYEDSQLRIQYEQAWHDLASERYGVDMDEERLEEIIERRLPPLQESVEKNDLYVYLADELGYSLDEFFYNFTLHIYERRAVEEELHPLLEDEYEEDAEDEFIRLQYRLEVIDEMLRVHS